MKSLWFVPLTLLLPTFLACQPHDRPRARDLGIEIGIFPTGTHNAITDVAGVRVGHVTLSVADSIRTGVTAVVPHEGNLFQEKVPAALFVGNGFGKLVGATQLEELGQIESPILLTNTLSVWDVADGIVDYMLSLPGNELVRSLNPIVGETNDGALNDIRGRHVTRKHAVEAIMNAQTGPVEEGCVGAGTGTICFGWKGGIGTSSRKLPQSLGGFTIGSLVQTNFGGILDIAGVPVGKELDQYSFRNDVKSPGDGSCMIVIATDAPLSTAQLKRVARRATLALGRTGSSMSHGSGDYVIAFSTAKEVRIRTSAKRIESIPRLRDEDLSQIFQAAVEATEEAVYNSLLRATRTQGYRGMKVDALPVDKLVEILKKYGRKG
ncbi:MAG TPA: P1 family peptidase [Bacteroidota bacterium]|nr:P1 family peptidase [Bacteroidota bacterium]